jgi:hypothetical protein
MKEIPPFPNVDYGENIGLDEALVRLDLVRNVFLQVRENYPPAIEDHSLFIDPEHLDTLGLCVGALLPLATAASVEEQVKTKTDGVKTVYEQTEELYLQIFEFAVGFKNSDVARTHDGGFIF